MTTSDHRQFLFDERCTVRVWFELFVLNDDLFQAADLTSLAGMSGSRLAAWMDWSMNLYKLVY